MWFVFGRDWIIIHPSQSLGKMENRGLLKIKIWLIIMNFEDSYFGESLGIFRGCVGLWGLEVLGIEEKDLTNVPLCGSLES